MRTLIKTRLFLVILFTTFLSGCSIAQQPSLQELVPPLKNIFLVVNAEDLFNNAGVNPINVTDYCALQGNAGVMKYNAQTKEKDPTVFSVDRGDEVTWRALVDPQSRSDYTISILQVIIKDEENGFASTYLPGKDKKVTATVLTELKVPIYVSYDIWFQITEKKTGDTKAFILDPWIYIK